MNPIVSLSSSASVCGKQVFARNSLKPVLAFLGIPFAEPPIGELRFAPPKAKKLWSGEREAKEFGPICPQNLESTRHTYFPFVIEDTTSEDCLYLNVWTPNTRPQKPLPVMVWFYGGAFIQGLSNYFDGTALSSKHDIVYVSFNYRVGPFGFMCTDDGYVKGNMGIFDQLEALKWIQKYIAFFGGNPDNVTVFGESAGGICIALHLLSPMSKGLFHRAIMESGSACYPSSCWSMQNASKYIFRHATLWSEFEIKSGKELVKFLADKPAAEIVKRMGLGFNPVLDYIFMPHEPVALCESGKFHAVDVLLGFNTDEGFQFVRQLMKTLTPSVQLANNTLNDIIFKTFFRGLPYAEKIRQILYEEYLKGVTDGQQLFKNIVEVYGDILFILPAVTQSDHHSKWVVADHGHEIPYVFGEPFLERLPDIWEDSERTLSSMIMTYWTNFAKTGDPNGTALPQWPAYTAANRSLMMLCSQPRSEPVCSRLQRRVNLWKEKVLPLSLKRSKL